MQENFCRKGHADPDQLVREAEATFPENQARHDLLFVLCELLRNGKEHGGAIHFDLTVIKDREGYQAEIRQYPPARPWTEKPPKDPDRGRGLRMVRALTQGLQFGPVTRFRIPGNRIEETP